MRRSGPPPNRRHRRAPRLPRDLPSSHQRGSRRRTRRSPPPGQYDGSWYLAQSQAAAHSPHRSGRSEDPGPPTRRHRSCAHHRRQPSPPLLPPARRVHRPSPPSLPPSCRVHRRNRRHPQLHRRSSTRRPPRSRRSRVPKPAKTTGTMSTAGRSPVDTTMAIIAARTVRLSVPGAPREHSLGLAPPVPRWPGKRRRTWGAGVPLRGRGRRTCFSRVGRSGSGHQAPAQRS